MTSRFIYGLFIGLPLGGTFWDLVGGIAKVDGRSMQPTLNPDPQRKDCIYLNKLDKYNVSRGDIVVLLGPKDPHTRIIKRITAVEGDLVTKLGLTPRVVSIPKGHIWVEGDSADQSADSNLFGPVPLGLVIAKVPCIIWPLDRIQLLKNTLGPRQATLQNL